MQRFLIMFFALALTVPALAASEFAKLARPGEHSATISGQPGSPANNLYPVRFLAVDGKRINGAREVIWLEPGRYTLTVAAQITNPPGQSYRRPSLRDEPSNTIEVVVEAGRTYYIYAQYDRARRGSEYQPVLHKVE